MAIAMQVGPGRWITGWNPEDERFWAGEGRRVARRNLVLSVLSEHIGFSVWSIWSVLVLFMSPAIGLGFGAGEKFLLVLAPTVTGALLRLPYSYAVVRFGGRNWTVFSTAILLVPTLAAWHFTGQPGTPLWVFLLIGAAAGAGGGNFASSMTNISRFYPRRHQGWALGLNAGFGNVGVAVVQVVGLLVIATAGDTHPSLVAAIYLPLIVLAAALAALGMDNLAMPPIPRGTLRDAVAHRHTWWITLLYIGTFGSFIGYGFAFGLVLQTRFGASPLQAASYTFLGPLLGSLARPAGGWLSDRWGGARVTFATFVAMAAGTGLLLVASAAGSFWLFVAAFGILFVLSGIGNGSAFRLIPVVFAGAPGLSATVIGIAGAIGALGGAAVNLAFRAAYGSGSGEPAHVVFLAYYAVCVLITWVVYLRPKPGQPSTAEHEAVARV